MAGIKDILKQPMGVLSSFEVNMPAGIPKLAGAMSSVVDSLPEMPAFPSAAGGARLPRVHEFVQGVEVSMPTGIPKFGAGIASAEEGILSSFEGLIPGGIPNDDALEPTGGARVRVISNVGAPEPTGSTRVKVISNSDAKTAIVGDSKGESKQVRATYQNRTGAYPRMISYL